MHEAVYFSTFLVLKWLRVLLGLSVEIALISVYHHLHIVGDMDHAFAQYSSIIRVLDNYAHTRLTASHFCMQLQVSIGRKCGVRTSVSMVSC